MGFFDYFNNDLAIDLGTANTLIISKGSVVVDEPSIIAIDRITNKVLAVGSEAMQMHEKTHENIKTIRSYWSKRYDTFSIIYKIILFNTNFR